MKAELYEVKICDGIIGYIHGMNFGITELHIPSIKASVNIVHGCVNCFRANFKERYTEAKHLGDIDVSDKFADAVNQYLDSQRNVSELVEGFFKDNELVKKS